MDHVSSTTTKNDGSYSLKKLPEAAYQVEFFDTTAPTCPNTTTTSRPSSGPTTCRCRKERTSQASTPAGQDGYIRGTVTDEQGQPVPGIFIDI